MNMAAHTMNEHELVHCPADRFGRVFVYLAFGVHKRDVRGEIPLCQTLQALPGQRDTEHSSKGPQTIHSVVPDQDEWTAAGPASKADGTIEPYFERRHPDFGSSLTCYLNDLLRQFTKKEQRDVQTSGFDDCTVES